MMIKLPSTIFYTIVIGILIIPFIISIIKIITSHKKYKKVDKNIKNIYEKLDGIHDEYEKKLLEKINQIDTNIKINSVSTSTFINDDKLLEYQLDHKIFKKKKINLIKKYI